MVIAPTSAAAKDVIVEKINILFSSRLAFIFDVVVVVEFLPS